jgi:DNA-binding Lrp family transcriptional regulator
MKKKGTSRDSRDKEGVTNLGGRPIDRLDRAAIEALCASGRESYHHLAKRLGVTTSTITHRVRVLEQQGILKGFRAVTDIEKLGYEFMAIVLVYAEGDGARAELNELGSVVGAFEVVGEFTLVAWIACKNREEFSGLMKRIIALPGVKKVNPYVIMEVMKDPRCFVPNLGEVD